MQYRKMAASMDEMGFDCVTAEAENKAGRDDRAAGDMSPRSFRARWPATMPGVSKKKSHPAMPLPLPEPQHVAKPRINLESSPASKFLVQLVPGELQLSPVAPFTPAAVPFKWEEAPGKPKPSTRDRRSSRPALHLPPRLLIRPAASPKRPPLLSPTEESGARHRRSGSSGSAEEKRIISIEQASEELQDDDNKSPRYLVDWEIPSPWDGHITPAYSPLRDLGPPDLHWRAKAYAFFTMWRRNSSSKHNKLKSPLNSSSYNNNPVSLHLNGGLIINEAANTESRGLSLNAMFDAAMGAKTEDFDFSNSRTMPYSKKTRPITDSEFYRSKMPRSRRTKRKWVVRKLRRPAQLLKSFFSAVWRAALHRSIGNTKHSYQSLGR